MANSVDPDEVAHDEPPHLGLSCLQIQLYVCCLFWGFKGSDFHDPSLRHNVTVKLSFFFSELFDEMTLKPFLEDLEQVYAKVLAEYPELSELGEINTDLLNQIQQVQQSSQ